MNAARARPAQLVVLTTAWSTAASLAWGQAAGSLLPSAGLGGGGSFQEAVESALPGTKSTVNTGLGFNFSGAIGAAVGVSDDSASGLDALAQLSPNINITGETRRLQLRLGYAPVISLYGSASNRSQISQGLNASGTVAVWPEHIFIEARGVSTTSSRLGGGVNTTGVNRNDSVTTSSFSVSPYYEQRFGGWGTSKVGASLSRTIQDNTNANSRLNQLLETQQQLLTTAGASPGFGVTGNLTTYQEYASFITGENFGRWRDSVSAVSQQYSGSQFYRGATRQSLRDELSYAYSRSFNLNVSGGYDQIRYPSVHYQLNQPSWTAGFTWFPNPDSSIKIAYGQVEGGTSLILDAKYSPTPRLSLVARYSTGVTTGLTGQQSLLGSTGVGVGGLLVDNVSGTPVMANGGFGSQFGLARVKRLSIASYYAINRETFSVLVENEERTQLTASTSIVGVTTPAGTSGTTTTGSFGWEHSINPATRVTSGVSYTVQDAGAFLGRPGTSFETLTLSSRLAHAFTQSVSGTVQYNFQDRTGAATRGLSSSLGGNSTQTSILVGVQKTF